MASLIAWLFPSPCAVCGRGATGWCARCLARAPRAPAAAPPAGLDSWVVPFAYEGAIREVVTGIKYRNRRAVLDALAGAIVERLDVRVPVDAVTWVPTTAERRRQRGFDHAQLLARAVGRRLGVPAVRLLRRVDATAQTGLTAAARRVGPLFAAAARDRVPGTVLLVDDVSTTGTSLTNAARVLRAQGCKWVIGAVVARALLKGGTAGTDKPVGSGADLTNNAGSYAE